MNSNEHTSIAPAKPFTSFNPAIIDEPFTGDSTLTMGSAKTYSPDRPDDYDGIYVLHRPEWSVRLLHNGLGKLILD